MDDRNDSYGKTESDRIQGIRRFFDRLFEMDSAAGRQSHAGDARLESEGGEADREIAFTGVEAGLRMESPLGDASRRAAVDRIFKPRMTRITQIDPRNPRLLPLYLSK